MHEGERFSANLLQKTYFIFKLTGYPLGTETNMPRGMYQNISLFRLIQIPGQFFIFASVVKIGRLLRYPIK